MKRALLVVDYSNDFVAEDGALTSGESGQALEENIVKLIDKFVENQEYIVFANDLHAEGDKYHPETSLFPPHNVEGTTGRALFGKVGEKYQEITDLENVYFTDKRRYSAFAGTDLDIRLRERDIKEVWIVGVATDICVLHTAVDAYNYNYDIVIPENGVASFNPEGHKWALGHFRDSLGVKVI